jgi:predicted adenylyl cyclase CyaB
LGAELAGESIQRDTYFQGSRGRLRVRQEDAKCTLFADERLALAGTEGRQWVFELAQPEVVLQAFRQSLGVEALVVKRRVFLHLGEVRIHLDNVEGLGNFIELTARTTEGSVETPSELSEVREALGISEACLIAASYPELLGKAPGPTASTSLS